MDPEMAEALTPTARWDLYEPAAPPEPGELVDRLGWIAAQLGEIGWSDDSASVARAATLLKQRAAPAPAVVPVAVSERLPDPRPESEGGDCDAEGFCWNGYGYSYDGENNIDSYAMWMLVPESDLRGEVCAPASAIPLPQAGEGEL